MHYTVYQSLLFSTLVSRSAPRRRSFGLAKMRMWAGEGKYRRLDQLQADLLAVLRQAREEGGRDSQVRGGGGGEKGCGCDIG